jgi:hypothetical protein
VCNGNEQSAVSKRLSLDGFLKKYDSEAQCEEASVTVRWPHSNHRQGAAFSLPIDIARF